MFRDFSKNATTRDIKIRFTIVFGLFGGIVFTIYSIINIFADDTPYVVYEGVLAIISLALSYLTYKRRTDELGERYGFIPIFAISLTNLAFGGFENTGIYWTFILPPVVVYLAGGKRSAVIVVFFAVLAIVYYTLTMTGYFPVRYSLVQFVTFIVSFLSIYFMSYLLLLSWNMSERLLESQKVDLKTLSEELSSKLRELELTKIELETSLEEKEKTNEELLKFNKLVVNREVKMAELKHQLKDQDTSKPDQI